MNRFGFTWFRLVSVAALGASIYVISGQLLHRGTGIAPAEKDKARSARVLTPTGGPDERGVVTDARMVSGTGLIEPRGRETKVAGTAAGLVVRIAVQEGQQVSAGQVLVEFESSSERSAVESAREEIESAKREFDKVKAGERAENIAAASGDLRAAQARAAQSADALSRLKGLAERDLVTRDEYDKARRQAEQDSAAAAASKSRYEALASGPRKEDVAIQQARIAQAEKRLEERLTQLRLRQVRAQNAGTVLQIKYRAGEYYVPSGEPLLLLGDLSQKRARIDIDERDIARVHAGDRAYVTASAFANRSFPARVAEVGQRIGRKNIRTDDPKERIDTKILEVVLDVEGDARDLIPGLRVSAVIGSKEPSR
jgi:multidrug resistance efflux pump